VAFDDIEELHLRYLKGMTKAYCVASMEHDEDVRKNAPVEPISEDEYHKGIEVLVGKCRCRGNYTFDAPPRCPKCRSTRIEDYGPALCYD
jgi:predicted Zn-ribbon and HTH transcriptional regulator